MEAEQRRRDAGGEPDPFGRLSDGADGREGEPGRAVIIHPGVEVLGDQHPVEARLLGEDSVVDQGLGLPLLVAAEVVEVGHREGLSGCDALPSSRSDDAKRIP